MFEKRLRWFVIAMTAVALLTVARLAQVQVVRAEHFRGLGDQMLTRPVRYLSAPRGSILDRRGRVLVSDVPTSDISVRYEALLALLDDRLPRPTRRYLAALGRSLRKRGRYPAKMPTDQIVGQLAARLDQFWDRLAELTGTPRSGLIARAARIRQRVEQIRAAVRSRSATIREIAEQHGFHALIKGVTEERALAARIEFEPENPWLRVVPSSRRVAHDSDALVHVLGRVGAASVDRIASDPLRDDELRGLRAGDRCGISGVERLADLTLRGTRGRVVEDFDRTVLSRSEPQPGDDVTLTIDADLQRRTLELLADAVRRSLDGENPAGGAAAVVLDVTTREALVLASYPTYSYTDYTHDYSDLARDTRWQPLRFRAVANMYPPGSTCKVIALYGALAEGLVTPDEQIRCTGYLLPNQPNRFRCWIFNRYRATHGLQDAENAIRNSCNIYFYTIGGRLGVARLCKWFEAFGLGRGPGTGLIEENAGIVPTPHWIRTHRPSDPRVYPADAWNFAIGQGEVAATPLQAANVAATVASGRWQPVKLLRATDDQQPGPAREEPIEFDQRYLQVLRTGMRRVVNERGATAFDARLSSQRYEMCGKTGSAQASRRVLSKKYTLRWPDGRSAEVIATSRREAISHFADPKPQVVHDAIYELFPPRGADDKLPSHAWFIGYTQPKNTPPGHAPPGRSYAISVIVEYGGSGGHVAGPIAKRIAEMLLEDQADGRLPE